MMIVLFQLIAWLGRQWVDRRSIAQGEEDLWDPKMWSPAGGAMINNETKDINFEPPCYVQRYAAVAAVITDLKDSGPITKVVDFGCAEMSFFITLKRIVGVEEVLEVDVDGDLLAKHASKVEPWMSDYLYWTRSAPLSVKVCCGSVTEYDPLLYGTHVVVAIELIEHLHLDTLAALPANVFGRVRPRAAIFTTPNAEFNVLFPNMPPSGMRHWDHKFEWTRAEFQKWAVGVVKVYPEYSVRLYGIGPGPDSSEHLGCCSQMAVFLHRDPQWTPPAPPSALEEGSYRIVREVDYPYTVETRTPALRVEHELKFRLAGVAQCYDPDATHLPLRDFLTYVQEYCPTLRELSEIVKSIGWTLAGPEEDPLLAVPLEATPSVSSYDQFEHDLPYDDGGDEWATQYGDDGATQDGDDWGPQCDDDWAPHEDKLDSHLTTEAEMSYESLEELSPNDERFEDCLSDDGGNKQQNSGAATSYARASPCEGVKISSNDASMMGVRSDVIKQQNGGAAANSSATEQSTARCYEVETVWRKPFYDERFEDWCPSDHDDDIQQQIHCWKANNSGNSASLVDVRGDDIKQQNGGEAASGVMHFVAAAACSTSASVVDGIKSEDSSGSGQVISHVTNGASRVDYSSDRGLGLEENSGSVFQVKNQSTDDNMSASGSNGLATQSDACKHFHDVLDQDNAACTCQRNGTPPAPAALSDACKHFHDVLDQGKAACTCQRNGTPPAPAHNRGCPERLRDLPAAAPHHDCSSYAHSYAGGDRHCVIIETDSDDALAPGDASLTGAGMTDRTQETADVKKKAVINGIQVMDRPKCSPCALKDQNTAHDPNGRDASCSSPPYVDECRPLRSGSGNSRRRLRPRVRQRQPLAKSCSLDSCLENLNSSCEAQTMYQSMHSPAPRDTASPCDRGYPASARDTASPSERGPDSGYPASASLDLTDGTSEDSLGEEVPIRPPHQREFPPSASLDLTDGTSDDSLGEEVPVRPALPPPPPVENGDVANNNRDGEGNNVEGVRNPLPAPGPGVRAWLLQVPPAPVLRPADDQAPAQDEGLGDDDSDLSDSPAMSMH